MADEGDSLGDVGSPKFTFANNDIRPIATVAESLGVAIAEGDVELASSLAALLATRRACIAVTSKEISQPAPISILDLVPDTLVRIMSYLPYTHRLVARSTCQRWKATMESNRLLCDVHLIGINNFPIQIQEVAVDGAGAFDGAAGMSVVCDRAKDVVRPSLTARSSLQSPRSTTFTHTPRHDFNVQMMLPSRTLSWEQLRALTAPTVAVDGLLSLHAAVGPNSCDLQLAKMICAQSSLTALSLSLPERPHAPGLSTLSNWRAVWMDGKPGADPIDESCVLSALHTHTALTALSLARPAWCLNGLVGLAENCRQLRTVRFFDAHIPLSLISEFVTLASPCLSHLGFEIYVDSVAIIPDWIVRHSDKLCESLRGLEISFSGKSHAVFHVPELQLADALTGLSKLETLALRRMPSIGDSFADVLVGDDCLSNSLTNLTVTFSEHLRDDGVRTLVNGLHKLQSLDVSFCVNVHPVVLCGVVLGSECRDRQAQTPLLVDFNCGPECAKFARRHALYDGWTWPPPWWEEDELDAYAAFSHLASCLPQCMGRHLGKMTEPYCGYDVLVENSESELSDHAGADGSP